MDQWQAYNDPSMNRPGQFNTGLGLYPPPAFNKYQGVPTGNGHQQTQPPISYTYETYRSPAAVTTVMPKDPMGVPTTPLTKDLDCDVTMEEADPYNRAKYSARPTQHRRSESAAARKYSPMNVLSPTAPYPSNSSAPQNYAFTSVTTSSSRPSPTRGTAYTSPNSQYHPSLASRQPPPRLTAMHSGMGGANEYQHNTTPPNAASFEATVTKPQLLNRGPVPKFTKVKQPQNLQPKINTQPPFRRANPEGGFISPLQALTTYLPATYRICNPSFKYESSRNPRRVLTKPSKGVKNDGYDNEESDYILYVNDILGSEEANHKNRYLILDVLGQGTFGQVVKCQNLRTQEVVAVKVIKNKTAYFNQSMMEVSVLDLINKKLDKNDDHHLLRLQDTFIHHQHLCLAFELLSVNLYELIKQNQFRGLSTTLVRVFAQQLLNSLSLLNKARLIHCDLKPENILLKNLESPIIKVIDFGSACDERQTVYTYIQSRFYRSPEVLLGLPYSSAIDMWSLGCIVVELFLGLPLFPGSSEYNQISRITEMLGLPPTWMLENGKQAGEFFEKVTDEYGRRSYRLKSMEQYSREHNTKEQPSKKYFQATTLPDIIRSYSMPRKNMKQAEIDREMNNRVAFIDFVRGLLTIDPLQRWSPQQAKLHPFITQQKFAQPFQPPSSTLGKNLSPGVQQQQAAEAATRHRAAQAQVHAHAQAQSAYAMQMGQYGPAQAHGNPMYNNLYQQGPPPPYGSQPAFGHQIGMIQTPGQMTSQPYAPSQSLYAQATTRAGRQRASTLDQQYGGIPQSIQRVASHLDPTQPIRLQPSPAYYPPPPDGYPDSYSQRKGNGRGNRDFIRTLEDGAMGDRFMNSNQWHG